MQATLEIIQRDQIKRQDKQSEQDQAEYRMVCYTISDGHKAYFAGLPNGPAYLVRNREHASWTDDGDEAQAHAEAFQSRFSRFVAVEWFRPSA